MLDHMIEFDLIIYGIVARTLLCHDKGLPFGRVEQKMIYTRASDRAVKGLILGCGCLA